MPIYTYNGATFSEEDVIAKAEEKGLDLDSYINKFGIKKEEDKVTEEPGKPKPVAKKDAVATAKSTVSKSAKSSPELQSSIWGETRTQPGFIEKLQEVTQPIPKLPKPVSVKPPKQEIKPISEYQKEVEKEEENSFSNYLKESFDSGVSTIVQSFYKAPEYVYDVAAVFTNPVANLIGDITGVETKDASSERIIKDFGIKNVPANILQERINKSNKIIQDYSAKNGVDPLTAIENGNYLGAAKLVAGGTTQSLPMMVAAMASGGTTQALAGISASTAISKAEQLKIEQPEMDVQTRTVNAAVSGLLEGYLGHLFTGASGAVVQKILTDKGAKVGSKIVSNGLMNTLETAIEKNPMIAVIGEVAEEGAVELGNQINDINSGIRKDLDYRAITNAGIIATGMGGVNTVPVYGAKGYMKAVEYNQVKSVNKEINTLTNQLSNPYVSDSDKKIISSRVNRLVDENKSIVGASLEKIDALPLSVRNEINTINTDLDDLKSKYLGVVDNTDLPLNVQQAMGQELELQAKELQNRKSSIIEGNYIYEDFNKLSEEEQNRLKTIATEDLTKEFEKTGVTTTPKEEEINRKAVNLYNTELKVANAAKEIELVTKLATTEKISEIQKGIGENKIVEIFNTPEELQKAYEKYHAINNLEGVARDVSKEAGFALGDQLVINKTVAENFEEGDTVGRHELLHKILKSSFSDSEAGIRLKNKFLEALSTKERNVIEKRLKDRGYTEDDLAKAPDEYLTQFFEALDKKEIEYSDTSFLTMWKTFLQPIYKKLGFRKLDFKSGTDVYNFIKDYHKSVAKGQLSERAIALKEKGIETGAKEALSKVKVAEVQAKIDKLEDQYDADEVDYDDYTSRLETLEKELEKAKLIPEAATKPQVEKPKVEATAEDEVTQIIKNEKGSISSDKVQRIYETKGVNGAQDIIDLFKPITNKIVDKRRDAPGFEKKLLTDEIETGAGGILDLIKSYNPSKGIPLAAYINKQLPLRAIAASRRVLDEQFSKDVTEEKAIMAEETVTETKEKPKYNNALESKVFASEVLKTATNKILTIVRTLKSRIDAPVTMNRTVTPLISEIRDEVGKQLDIDIKTMLGGKKDGVLKKELLRTKRYILENMTTTWLMGKDGQGGIPQAIQKQIDGRWVSYPDWAGQKIDREKTTTDQAGRTSGAELVRRLPNVFNNVSDADFLAQIIGPDGNPIRGRKESLSKAMSEEGAFDIINNDFENNGPIFEAFKINQERLGVEILNNSIVEFARQAERGNIKFSKTLLQKINDNSVEIANHISINGAPTLNNTKQALISVFPDWDKNEINNAAIILTPNVVSAFKQFQGLKKGKPVDLILGSIKNIVNDLDTGTIITKKVGSNISVAEFFRTPAYFNDIKALDFEFSEAVLKKYGREKGLDLLSSLWKPTVSGKTTKGAISIYEGAKGYNDHLLNLQKNTGNGKIEEINQTYKKINRVFDNNLNGKFDKEKDIKKSDEAWGLAVFAADWYSNEILNPLNNYGPEHLAAIYTLLIKENDSVLRSAAPVTGIIIDDKIKDLKKYDYDHSKPVSYIARRLIDKFVYNKDVDLKLLKQDYEVNIIPKTISDKLNELGLKSMMPVDYREGVGSYIRIGKATERIISKYEKFAKTLDNQNAINNDAVTKSLISFSKTAKGISVFDFDDTVGLTKSNVLYTMPDGTTGKLNGAAFAAQGASLLEAGAIFDFSEFSKVVDGKPGPMVEKMKKMIAKFGPDNFFILTARPADSAGPIQQFLSSIGIDIPLENITGLGSSLAQAKADWITAKAAEGYNDFYFADDHMPNVNAVKNALDVLDVKSKIQQARAKFSKTISPEFNKIIEVNRGVEEYKVFSDIVAKRRGAGKNKFDIYVPASAADFELLLYNFLGKGTIGDAQKKFFSDALLKPYANGNDLMDAARQSIKNDYKALTDTFPDIRNKIEKLTPDGDFTYDQAIRVAMWKEAGIEIPGLSERDANKLATLVNSDPELQAFKAGLIIMGRQGAGWITPTQHWDADTIIADLHNITENEGRRKFLAEFIENSEEMFGKFENGKLVGPNINKVEAIYGTNVKEAIEDSLYRMINGKNRSFGQDKETSMWSNWVNGSTGTIMFLNTRSAALQLIGAVNFLNLRDNNPIAAGVAFANQKQYWEDFARIWNSDKMKERRGGLKEDVAAAEIANAAATSKNKATAVVSYLLKIGYTPTQLADSFAIASGGAPFYRNRIKSYLKEGLTETEAETAAWNDFTKVSDETQQSGDPRDISKQQASGAGRLLLTFQNTAMQQSRIVKKSFLDLKNGRGDAKTHIAKITYYLAIQNIMFAALQQGLFAVLFNGDEEDDDKEKAKKLKAKNKKLLSVADGVLDSVLRGTGMLGGVVATLKNVIEKYLDEKDKNYKADYAKVVLEGANISPPIGSKLKKLYSGLQQTKFEKDLIKERGWGIMQDGRVHLGPMYSVTGKVVEATANLPMDRLVTKVENISQMMNAKNKAWQRVMIGLGWNPRSIGVEESEADVKIRETAKATRKEEGKVKTAETRARTKDSIRQLPISERIKLKREASLKRREEKIKKRKRKMGGD